ncbi:symmetrical bis(5'-nucleosyl)-tetraphosphatase [Pseudoalteromonas sp. T1lg65]|uniref:symmetrical bis(5'-nucleosyl)-tetraphosphatase n=1 Tax=Pseudoalteromonas sp. T1lg65 TaxID=2077101 RepID=UPI003F7A54D3
MANYAIGDLQGCFAPFIRLLEEVDFNPSRDHLYSVGDVIARGPDSLACLNFLYQNAGAVTITLGNHDLHFLACSALNKAPNPKDKLEAVFNSEMHPAFVEFLRSQPIAIWLEQQKTFISHAGLHPSWKIAQAIEYARFAESIYQSEKATEFYAAMYGKHPNQAIESLSNKEKFKAIVNVFTRMRFVDANGDLELTNKSGPNAAQELLPWFKFGYLEPSIRYIFGHWAALEGKTDKSNIIALDTGCVWGGHLTMLNLDTNEYHRCP